MKAILKLIHSIMISIGLLWSLPGIADVKKNLVMKELSAEAFVAQFEIDFHNTFVKINKNRKNIPSLLTTLTDDEKKYFMRLFRTNRISSLPSWKARGEGYETSIQGNRIFISPRLSYQGKVKVNGKIFTFRSRDLKKEQIRFENFMVSKRKFSMLNLIIDDAHAAGCLGACILILFGITALVGYLTYDEGMTTLEGDQASLNKLLMTLKEKKGQCSIDFKELRYESDSATPGDQDTFQDLKKIDQHVKAKIVVQDDEKKKLHPYILKEVLGVNVNSCEEFADLWVKKAGALNRSTAGKGKMDRRKEVCKVVDSYASCITNYKYVESRNYDGERRDGKDYRPETGRFGDRTLGQWFSDTISK